MVEVTCVECAADFEAGRQDAKYCATCRCQRRRELQERSARKTKRDTCTCGRLKWKVSRLCKSCDQSQRQFGERNHAWRGGRSRQSQGYIELRVNGRKVLEHRHLWEQANGLLPPNWVIHHLNGLKDDNRLENLVAMSRSHHGPRAHIDPTIYEARIRELEGS